MINIILIISILISKYAFADSFDNLMKAKYSVLMDYDTGAILYERNAHEPNPPSSMSKLMTSYLVFEHIKNKTLNLDDNVIVSKEAWSKGGSKMFVMIGSQVKVSDLLLGMIIQSGNDATIALAEAIGGNEANFADMMNLKAQALGLKNSHFVNATGWPDKGQEMSAYDLALLAKHLIKDFPESYHYFSQREYTYNGIRQFNRNSLLNKSNFMVDGLKTGRTDIAGYGIVVSAKKKQRRLIAVVNGLNSDGERVNEVNQLLGYGFNSFSNVLIAKAGQNIKNIEVYNGEEDTIPLKPQYDIFFTVDNDKLTKLKIELRYNQPMIAPIMKGDVIGTIVVHGLNDQPLEVAIKAERDCLYASKLKQFTKALLTK